MGFRKYFVRALLVLGMVVGSTLAVQAVVTGPASAASYAKGVYTPTLTADWQVEGWADVNAKCDDTWGCWTYVKIERLTNCCVINWWEYQGGGWANDGWNKVAVPARGGCAHYRVVVDSYNDSPSNSVAGVNLGPVQFGLGGGVKRYHKTFTSNSAYLCPMA